MSSHSHTHSHDDGHTHSYDHDHTHCHGLGHTHSHAPKVTRNNLRRVGLAAFLTGLFMIAEIVGGLISGSLALLADAGHMLMDFVALLLAWLAFLVGARPANQNYNFGFNRVAVLIAFINGLTLFIVSFWIVWEAVQRFLTPGEVLATPMLIIAIMGLVVNLIVFKILAGADQGNFNIRGAMLHVLGDMLGSIGAILAAIIILFTNWTLADPILSILVAIIILRSAWALIKETGHVLIQGAPRQLDPEDVRQEIKRFLPEISTFQDFRIWSMSHDELVLTFRASGRFESKNSDLLKELRVCLSEKFGIEHLTVELSSDP